MFFTPTFCFLHHFLKVFQKSKHIGVKKWCKESKILVLKNDVKKLLLKMVLKNRLKNNSVEKIVVKNGIILM